PVSELGVAISDDYRGRKDQSMRVRIALTLVMMSVLYQVPGTAQSGAIIGPDEKPLGIKAGMTLKEAIDSLEPEYQTYALGGDSGWFLQIHDSTSWEEVLMSFWSDECQDYTINYAAKIRAIVIHSPKYKTREGVHVGMLLAEAEKKLGEIKRIYTSEPTFEEYAEFANMPKGVDFAVSGGLFKEGERETLRYSPDARISKITLGGGG
ncbi:MAG: hypothetical protein SF066_03565, partial [Thermoanaerobaculia bacterium]|nr:hypothetical protein [Thermoanaerobaculia bacterium]